jgi:hypothetical protein
VEEDELDEALIANWPALIKEIGKSPPKEVHLTELVYYTKLLGEGLVPGFSFKPKERLVLFHATRPKAEGSGARSCVFLTTYRVIKHEKGKMDTMFYLKDLSSVELKKNGLTKWDQIHVQLRTEISLKLGIYLGSVAEFFTALLANVAARIDAELKLKDPYVQAKMPPGTSLISMDNEFLADAAKITKEFVLPAGVTLKVNPGPLHDAEVVQDDEKTEVLVWPKNPLDAKSYGMHSMLVTGNKEFQEQKVEFFMIPPPAIQLPERVSMQRKGDVISLQVRKQTQ